jgi:hypothetical protein
VRQEAQQTREKADIKDKELQAALTKVDKHFWEAFEIGNQAMKQAMECQNRAMEREEEFQEYFIYATQAFPKERKLRRKLERAANVAQQRFWRFFLGRA